MVYKNAPLEQTNGAYDGVRIEPDLLFGGFQSSDNCGGESCGFHFVQSFYGNTAGSSYFVYLDFGVGAVSQ